MNVERCYQLARRVWWRWRARWLTKLTEEDAIQEAVLACWKQHGSYDQSRASEDTFYSWVCYSAMSMALAKAMKLSLGARVPHSSLDVVVTGGVPLSAAVVDAKSPDPAAIAEQADLFALAEKALLDQPSYRQAAMADYFGLRGKPGSTLREIAAARGVSRAAVNAQVCLALDGLRKRLFKGL